MLVQDAAKGRSFGGKMGFFSNRRDAIIDSYLSEMKRRGITDVDVSELYFDAAVRFAQDHGGTLYDDMCDSILFSHTIDGTEFSVMFMRGRGRQSTNITLMDATRASATVGIVETRQPKALPWAHDPEMVLQFWDGVCRFAHEDGVPMKDCFDAVANPRIAQELLKQAAEFYHSYPFKDQQECTGNFLSNSLGHFREMYG